MKTYRVIVTPLALEHIQRITDYIADLLQAPDTALRWLDKTEHAISPSDIKSAWKGVHGDRFSVSLRRTNHTKKVEMHG